MSYYCKSPFIFLGLPYILSFIYLSFDIRKLSNFITCIFQLLAVPTPGSTAIDLPGIKLQGYYLEIRSQPRDLDIDITSGKVSPSHGYLNAVADISSLEQNLTTDLVNHLIFLQKGFLKVFG